MLAAKRSFEDEDMSGGTERWEHRHPTESDAEAKPEKRRRSGAYRKPRPPRHAIPPAFIQLSPALQSELRKLQPVATRGTAVSKAEWDSPRLRSSGSKWMTAMKMRRRKHRSARKKTQLEISQSQHQPQVRRLKGGVRPFGSRVHRAQTFRIR